jgi:signal transduction histidine kinase
MIKYFLHIIFLLFISTTTTKSQHYLDSLVSQLHSAKADTDKIVALSNLSDYYCFTGNDSSFPYAEQTIELSRKIKYPLGETLGLNCFFYAFNTKANYPKALEMALRSLRIAEQLNDGRDDQMAQANYEIGLVNRYMENYPEALNHFWTALSVHEELKSEIYFAYSQISVINVRLKKLDSALTYAQEGYQWGQQSKKRYKYLSLTLAVLGNAYEQLKNYDSAEKYYRLGLIHCERFSNSYIQARIYNNLAAMFDKEGKTDSCINYARLSLAICQKYNFPDYATNPSYLLRKIFESKHMPDSTVKYLNIILASKDSVFSQANTHKIQDLISDESQRERELNEAKERFKNEIRLYILLSAAGILLLVAIILFRNNRQKQKANLLLQQQKKETEVQKNKTEEAFRELKSTQTQLIHAEKMASLGEITAGIAHEIQNPLNFVNNFSDINRELLDEMKDELQSGNINSAIAIADNIQKNLEKITHHGSRADAIVKGMLQHSRVSSGQKEPTNINVLTNEYLQISYHGMRAKDKLFNVALSTDLDESIGKINIVPQDLGRVLLNLFNNAFYSVFEKKKRLGDQFNPVVTVSTKKVNEAIEIRVRDNGFGISQPVIDKIFQPFYTTKPTGQGTGLGLSMSYDIITKEHGGTIEVETNENEYAEFIIRLPMVETIKTMHV